MTQAVDKSETHSGLSERMTRLFYSYRLDHILVLVGVIAALLGLGRAVFIAIEANRWRVSPDEQAIAERVLELGGTYHADKGNNRHIERVWLEGSTASDEDVRLILRLPFLTYLDVSDTGVTDDVICDIAAHKALKVIKVRGSKISVRGLRRIIEPQGHLLLSE